MYKYECDKLVLLSFCVTYFVDRKFIVMLPLHNMCYVFLIVRYANYILLVLLPTTVMLKNSKSIFNFHKSYFVYTNSKNVS